MQLATGAAHQAILIDDQAIGSDQGRNYVLVVGADNKAQYRPIELGAVVDGLRVVKSGLKAGENIIIKGLVRPGMAVTPRLTPMQASGASVSEGEKAGSVEGEANNEIPTLLHPAAYFRDCVIGVYADSWRSGFLSASAE